jgi:hypothetical protein
LLPAGESGGSRVPITLSITMSQSKWDRFQEDQLNSWFPWIASWIGVLVRGPCYCC